MKYASLTRVYLNTDELREKLGVHPRTHNQLVKLNPTTRRFEKFRFSQGVDIDHEYPIVLAKTPSSDPTAYLNIETFYSASVPITTPTPATVSALHDVVSRRARGLRTPAARNASMASLAPAERLSSKSDRSIRLKRWRDPQEIEGIEDKDDIFAMGRMLFTPSEKRQRRK